MPALEYNETLEILRKVNIFSGIQGNDDAMRAVTAMMEKKTYTPNAVLIEQGKTGDEFFVLVKGTVSIYRKNPEGDPYKVAILQHSNHPAFGEGGLMEGEVRSATIICDGPVECLVLSRRHFDDFCSKSPQYALPVFRKIAQGMMARLNQTSNDLILLHKALMDEIRQS